MPVTEQNILHFIRFADMSKWSANTSVFDGVKVTYPLIQLSKVLNRIKEPIIIDDDCLYKRITVRLYGQGVLQRDEIFGKDIGTKRQFVAHAGQLIISRIDARNGAFGIVPDELEGAIVTNDFWLFDVRGAQPQYIMLILSSKLFQKYWQTQSSGTTNRQRVNEDDFLQAKIPLPSMLEQQRLLNKYNAEMRKADGANKKIDELYGASNNFICERLHITCSSKSKMGLLNTVDFRHFSRWDPPYLKSIIHIESAYPTISLSQVINSFMVDQNGGSLRRNTSNENGTLYQYIGMENIEKNTGKRTVKEVRGSEILSQTLRVPTGYILYGKLRPYLNKYWENTTVDTNIICSSEFFVFDTKNIDRKYFLTVLASEIIQKQLPPLYSGARMPRITEKDFLGLQIPLPPEAIQREVARFSTNIKSSVDALRVEAENLRMSAQKGFEEAVFGEV